MKHLRSGAGARLRLLWTLVALVILALASWGISLLALGPWGTVLALAIAFAKAGLVAWNFMELHEASFVERLIAVLTVTFFVLLIAGVITDVLFR